MGFAQIECNFWQDTQSFNSVCFVICIFSWFPGKIVIFILRSSIFLKYNILLLKLFSMGKNFWFYHGNKYRNMS